MAYDLEEQEQLAALKAWWSDNGRTVLVAIVLAVAVAGGYVGWRAWQGTEARKAGALYETLARGAAARDAKAVREAGAALAQAHPGTHYASMGAFAEAKFLHDTGDLKGAQARLRGVMERGSSEEFRQVARLRLAASLMDSQVHDEALKLLEVAPAPALAPLYEALKGDLHAAAGRRAEAVAAYRSALEKSAPGSAEAFRASVQLRLDGLGS